MRPCTIAPSRTTGPTTSSPSARGRRMIASSVTSNHDGRPARGVRHTRDTTDNRDGRPLAVSATRGTRRTTATAPQGPPSVLLTHHDERWMTRRVIVAAASLRSRAGQRPSARWPLTHGFPGTPRSLSSLTSARVRLAAETGSTLASPPQRRAARDSSQSGPDTARQNRVPGGRWGPRHLTDPVPRLAPSCAGPAHAVIAGATSRAASANVHARDGA